MNRISIITEEERFEHRVPGFEGTVFTLRRLPPDLRRELLKEHTKLDDTGEKLVNDARIPEDMRRNLARVLRRFGSVDDEAFQDAALVYCLVDWRGVLANGEEIPCTEQFKRGLPKGVKAELLAQAGRYDLPSREDEKNSDASPSSAAGTQE